MERPPRIRRQPIRSDMCQFDSVRYPSFLIFAQYITTSYSQTAFLWEYIDSNWILDKLAMTFDRCLFGGREIACMSYDPLESLIAALEQSPENAMLRQHVVRELLKGRRFEKANETAASLGELPLRHLAQAWFEVRRGRITEAKQFYDRAIAADRSLIDEALEAELEPSTPLQMMVDMPPLTPPPPPKATVQTTTFKDIGGMESLKEQIRLNILYPIQKPELYKAYGKKVGGGILMYGPPGCGKTHIARATAGELGANFYVMGLQDILSKWIGETEKSITALFDAARSTSPSVIFIDEVDALGSKRSDIQSASIRWMVSQLLMEMDGISARNEQVLVLGATNAPWNVDSAMRRPGRFDRILFVPPPDAAAREQVLGIQCQGRKLDPRVSLGEVAKKTEFFSGADLLNLVERSTEKALSDALKTGNMRDVTTADFLSALKDCKPSTMEWLRRSRNYVNFANQDGIYDELSQFLDRARIR